MSDHTAPPSQLHSETFAKRLLLPPANGGTSDSNFNPRNTQCIPVVKIFVFLDLEQNLTFFKGLTAILLLTY
jgi:hypothetical protein